MECSLCTINTEKKINDINVNRINTNELNTVNYYQFNKMIEMHLYKNVNVLFNCK